MFSKAAIWGSCLVTFAIIGPAVCAPVQDSQNESADWTMSFTVSGSLFVCLAVGLFCCSVSASRSRTGPQPQVVVRTDASGAPQTTITTGAVVKTSEPNPPWVTGATQVGNPGNYAFDSNRMSSKLIQLDQWTVMKMSPDKGTYGVMTKGTFKKGKHVFDVTWTKEHRGAFASIGVARASMALENNKAITLVGDTSKSTGLDLVRKKVFHLSKAQSNNNYPAAALGVEIPDTFTMLLDADVGEMYFGQEGGTWGKCFTYKYVNEEPVHVMVGLTHTHGAVKLQYRGSSGAGCENANDDVPPPAGTVTAPVINPNANYGKTPVTGQPLWVTDLAPPETDLFGWGERDSSISVLDRERILYLAPSSRYTAGARLKMPMTSGKFVYEVYWPQANRGRFATIGITTKAHPISLKEATSLVGNTSAGYGIDLVRRKAIRTVDQIKGSYPRVNIPDQFYMFVDMDVGSLAFGAEVDYWDTAFTNIKKGEEYYATIGCCEHAAMITVKYRGCSRDTPKAQEQVAAVAPGPEPVSVQPTVVDEPRENAEEEITPSAPPQE